MPSDFGIGDAIRALAIKRGYAPFLEAHLEYFRNYGVNGHGGKQPLYVDWNKAFWNSILGDWGDVRRNMKRDGFKPAAVVETSCSEVEAGERCGMPGERFGDRYLCSGHRAKRMERRPMPSSIRAALKHKQAAT